MKTSTSALVVLAVLAVIAALYLLKAVLVPVVLALVLACLLSPVTKLIRRVVPLGSTGAAVLLFVMTTVAGLYLASLVAESLVQAVYTLPGDIERMSGQLSSRINDMVRDQPYLKGILPESRTIDLLGATNRELLLSQLSYRLTDLTGWIAQGFIVLVLVLFLLAESEMLTPKLVRFFTPSPGDARAAERTLKALTRQIRAYLLARTAINMGVGLGVTLTLWVMKIPFAVALGVVAFLTNYVPYVGQLLGGALPVLVTLGHSASIGDALIVAAVYLAILGIEGYVVTPVVLSRSLDLNGTTVLLACLFWGFLWGMVGLVLAMPITVAMKLVFQHVPSLHRWAELMSLDWQTPPASSTRPARVAERIGEPAPPARVAEDRPGHPARPPVVHPPAPPPAHVEEIAPGHAPSPSPG